MTMTESTWILLCDQRGGRLFQAHQTALGKPRLEEVEQRSSEWVAAERNRPAPVSTCGAQDYESWEGLDQEHLRFRAREVLAWMRMIGRKHKPQRMLLVAPGALGGLLRSQRENLRPLEPDIVLAELSSVPTHRLAEHKVVTGWLEYARTEGR